VIGLSVLPALAARARGRNRGALPFATGLVVTRFFSHSLLAERPVLLLLGIVGAGSPGAEPGVDADAGPS
jgi:hypothetical protein